MKLLSLDNTNFSGYVPVQLSHLSSLTHLTFSSTIICPGGSLCQVYEFKLETDAFKKMLQNMTNLRELFLLGVDMSDVEPVTSMMNISSSLTVLELSSCELQGTFPETVFRLPNLLHLDLLGNDGLTGSLPTFNWSSPLRYLDLSDSRISIDLSYLCTTAKSLQELYLRNSSFKGSYPALTPNLTQLVQLTSLDISQNNFQAQIPWYSLNLQQIILYLF